MSELFCKSCRFFMKIEKQGECHRNSPKPMVIPVTMAGPNPTTLTVWPVVQPSDWCHDYEPAESIN